MTEAQAAGKDGCKKQSPSASGVKYLKYERKGWHKVHKLM